MVIEASELQKVGSFLVLIRISDKTKEICMILRPRLGNNSRLSGILGFSQQIFCESAEIATSEITQFSVKILIFNNLTENLNSLTENFLSLTKMNNQNFL